MVYSQNDRIFDTLFDTNKNHVSKMNIKFKLRKDVRSNDKHPIYIHITGNSKREVINTGLHVHASNWLEKKERAKPIDKEHQDLNLILDKCQNKIHDIKIAYRLSDQPLSPAQLKKEYFSNLNRVNFVAFYQEALEYESRLSAGRIRVLNSILNKLKEYNEYIPFHDINANWFKSYRLWLKNVKKNNEVTISINIRAIKKFLRIAQKSGIKLQFDMDDVVPGKTTGNRNYLTSEELKKTIGYYYSGYLSESNRIILGYFLFGCMTGLRISNIQKLKRSDLEEGEISIVMVKGNKDKVLSLNETAKKIIDYSPELFVKKFTNEEMNRSIKKILQNVRVTKRISFHCARHTFATMMLKSGSKVEMLQQLLGHSSVKQTMIYSHIIQEDANKEIFLLDKLFH
jgi:integrase